MNGFTHTAMIDYMPSFLGWARDVIPGAIIVIVALCILFFIFYLITPNRKYIPDENALNGTFTVIGDTLGLVAKAALAIVNFIATPFKDSLEDNFHKPTFIMYAGVFGVIWVIGMIVDCAATNVFGTFNTSSFISAIIGFVFGFIVFAIVSILKFIVVVTVSYTLIKYAVDIVLFAKHKEFHAMFRFSIALIVCGLIMKEFFDMNMDQFTFRNFDAIMFAVFFPLGFIVYLFSKYFLSKVFENSYKEFQYLNDTDRAIASSVFNVYETVLGKIKNNKTIVTEEYTVHDSNDDTSEGEEEGKPDSYPKNPFEEN